MGKNLVLVAVIAASILLAAGSAFAMIIDDFGGLTTIMEPTEGETITNTQTGLTGTIGGSRTLAFTLDDGPAYEHPRGILYGPGSFYSIALGPSSCASFSSFYDANGSGLGVDLSNAADINVHFWPDHFGFVKSNIMSITLKDAFGNSATDTRTWNAYQVINHYMDVSFLTADFGGVDLSDIYSIRLAYETDYANDVIFKNITTTSRTPEPATILLFSLGGLATVLLKRKKI